MTHTTLGLCQSQLILHHEISVTECINCLNQIDLQKPNFKTINIENNSSVMINELEQTTPASAAFNSSLDFKTGFIF